MKKNLHFVVLALAFLLCNAATSFAQITLPTPSPYVQNFDDLSTSGLPSGWSVRTGASATALGATANFAVAKVAWNNTAGNFKNVASADGLTSGSSSTDQSNSTDRSLSVRQTGAFGDPGAAFVLQLANTAGRSNLSLSFKLQSLDISSIRAATWRVDYGIGATPSSFTTVATNPALITTGNSTFTNTNVTVNFGAALDNISDNVWIRIVTLTATTGSQNRPTTGIDDVSLAFISGDVVPPSFTAGYPNTANFTTSGFDLLANLNESGKVYYAIVSNDEVGPTSVQIKNGQDANGNPLPAGFRGVIDITSPSTEFSSTITGLAHSTDYDVYIVAEDVALNLQSNAVKLDIRTNTPGDLTPPVFALSYPAIGGVATNGFDVKANLNELGTVYFVVLLQGAAAPTSVQVKQGRDAANVPVADHLSGSILIDVSDTEIVSRASGLTPNTTYDVYVVAEDNVPNIQAEPVKVSATTHPLFTESFEGCDNNSFIAISVAGNQVWSCTDFGRGTGSKGYRMNGFAGSSNINEDWLISPPLELGVNAALSFYSQFSFAGNSLQLRVSTDYSGNGDPNAATWINLNGNFPTVAVPSNSSSIADWTFSEVNLSAFAGQQVFLAYVYTSTSTAASRWTLDEINVTNAVGSYLSVVPSNLSFNEPGVSKSYQLKGVNLQEGVTVSAPAGFQVSKDNNLFTTEIAFSLAEVNANPLVHVKFIPPVPGTETYSGGVANASAGVSTRNVIVKGTDITQSFDIAAYNTEFFGSDVRDDNGREFGPIDDALQIANVRTVLQTMKSDVFAVEEVADDPALDQLVAGLPGYNKIMSDRWSHSFEPPDPHFPPQKVGFIYNTSTINVVSSRAMFAELYDAVRANTAQLPNYPGGDGSSFWSSGRLPFMATADVTINSVQKRVRMIVLHSKSGSAQEDYNRRKYDAKVLYDTLIAHYPNDNIIILGDLNDDVDGSILPGAESSYKVFVDDQANFSVLTLPLSQSGGATFPSSGSFLDHIIISNELVEELVPNSTVIEDPRLYIANYTTTTSDHLPVGSRFSVKANQTILFELSSPRIISSTPFTLEATASSNLPVSFSSSDPSIVSIAGNTATIHQAGEVTITASQAGNHLFKPASVSRQLVIENKANQTITFAAIADKTIGGIPFSLIATASSGLAVSFTSASDKISISGNQVNMLRAGRVTVTANQAGNELFNSAPPVDQSFCIKPAKPVATLAAQAGTSRLLISNATSGNQWYMNGIAIPGATNRTLTVTASGLYKVQVTIDDCTSAFSNDVPVRIFLPQPPPKPDPTLYPNPADDYLQVSGLEKGAYQCAVVDMVTGAVVMLPLKTQEEYYYINISELTKGMYLLKVQAGDKVQQMKFVKN
jgi:Secretion system C-terminal sorting domain